MSDDSSTCYGPLEGRTFFHGTSASSAVCISIEGLRILDRHSRFWSGHLGRGIYLTRNLEMAAGFSTGMSLTFGTLVEHSYILELALTPGVRVLRLEDSPDRQLLDSLRKEFGHEVLTNQFSHAIPSNKHLRPKELIAIISHLTRYGEQNDQAKRDIRKWVSRLGYHGYGHTKNDYGIVIYDPSRLRLRKIWAVEANEAGYSISIDRQSSSTTPRISPSVPAKLINHAELEIDSSEKRLRWSLENEVEEELEYDPEYQFKIAERLSELEHRRRMLDEYRSRQS